MGKNVRFWRSSLSRTPYMFGKGRCDYFGVLLFILVFGVKDTVWLVKKMKKKDVMNIDFMLREDDTYNFVEFH